MEMSFFMSAYVYSDLTVGLALKNDFKIAKIYLLDQRLWKSIFKSSDLYSDLTVGLALKNYPKVTLHLLRGVDRSSSLAGKTA